MVEAENRDGDGDNPQQRPCRMTPELRIQAGTLIVLAVTMAGVFWYACVANRSLKQQIIATQAAKKAADAAASAAKTARDALTLTELAEIEPTGVTCQPNGHRPHEFFALYFKNVGKTRAINIKSTWWYQIGGKDCQVKRPSRDFDELQWNDSEGDGGGSPAQNIRVCLGDLSYIMASAAITEIEEGGRQFALVGRIYYDDAIGDHHLKAFTYTYQPSANPNDCNFEHEADNEQSY